MSAPLVLIVEDNPADAELADELFQSEPHACATYTVVDTEPAIQWLGDRALEGGIPDLILLDLNLIRGTGFDVLHFVRNTNALSHVPIVIFSSSVSSAEISRCYNAGANAFVAKAFDLSTLEKSIRALKAFWFDAATLPK